MIENSDRGAPTLPSGPASSPENALLELRGLSWRYGASVILKDVSLTLSRGEIVAVLGASGSGKSTLLALAGLLRRPLVGQVFHDGVDIASAGADWVEARRRRIRFVFQRPNLLRSLTILENVETGALATQDTDALLRSTAESLLSALGLQSFGNRWPEELSGGEQQRVAVARSMIGRPDLLFADEPTASLDFATSRLVIDHIRKLTAEYRCGVIIVTHDLRIADVASRRFMLEGGALSALA